MPEVNSACKEIASWYSLTGTTENRLARHKALDGIEGNGADVAFASGVVYAALKACDDETDDVQRPRKVVEELHDALHPAHLEELRAHAAHLGEEVSEEAYDLAVEPVKYLIQYLRRDKIPYKY